MARYTRLQRAVDAVQYQQDDGNALFPDTPEWVNEALDGVAFCPGSIWTSTAGLWVGTSTGNRIVQRGEWIVRDENYDLQVMSHEDFIASLEPEHDQPPALSLNEDLARTIERWQTDSLVGAAVIAEYMIGSLRAAEGMFAAVEAAPLATDPGPIPSGAPATRGAVGGMTPSQGHRFHGPGGQFYELTRDADSFDGLEHTDFKAGGGAPELPEGGVDWLNAQIEAIRGAGNIAGTVSDALLRKVKPAPSRVGSALWEERMATPIQYENVTVTLQSPAGNEGDRLRIEPADPHPWVHPQDRGEAAKKPWVTPTVTEMTREQMHSRMARPSATQPQTYGGLLPGLLRWFRNKALGPINEQFEEQPPPTKNNPFPVDPDWRKDFARVIADLDRDPEYQASLDMIRFGAGAVQGGKRIDPREFFAPPADKETPTMRLTLNINIREIGNGLIFGVTAFEDRGMDSRSNREEFFPDYATLYERLPALIADAHEDAKIQFEQQAAVGRAHGNQERVDGWRFDEAKGALVPNEVDQDEREQLVAKLSAMAGSEARSRTQAGNSIQYGEAALEPRAIEPEAEQAGLTIGEGMTEFDPPAEDTTEATERLAVDEAEQQG